METEPELNFRLINIRQFENESEIVYFAIQNFYELVTTKNILLSMLCPIKFLKNFSKASYIHRSRWCESPTNEFLINSSTHYRTKTRVLYKEKLFTNKNIRIFLN